jgi:pimeloyl-ACP methyl ester carboxylesterase
MAMSPPKTDDEVPPQRTPMTVITDPYCPTMSELYVVPGVVVVERFFTVPLDYRNESRGTIQIFARHCIQLARHKQMEQLPFMVYLQGGMYYISFVIVEQRLITGPGMEASSQPPSNSGMLKVLMDRGYQVLLLDQRGTGLSTPISGRTLADIGTLEEQVEYVKLFRADNIGTSR